MTSEDDTGDLDRLIRDVVHDAADAVGAEIGAARTRTSDTIELTGGRVVGSSGSFTLWSFSTEANLTVPAETPGSLRVPGLGDVPVVVVAVGDLTLLLGLGLGDDLGERLDHATLSLDATFVYHQLVSRLEDLLISAGDSTLIDALIAGDVDDDGDAGAGPSLGRPGPPDVAAEQERAAERAVEPGVRFTWGPPGTGKTNVLARAALLAVTAGQRVLVVSHANAAVDVAIARIVDALAEDEEGAALLAGGRILRVGTPHRLTDTDLAAVLPEAILDRQHPDLAGKRNALDAERRRLVNDLRTATGMEERQALVRRLETIRSDARALASEVAEATRLLIDEAAVIGATLSKVVVDEHLWSWPSTVVLVDEASMAALPFVLAFALRDGVTLSFFGDFRQLPPIAASDHEGARRWFGRDVFEYCGVADAHETGRRDGRLSVLRTQFRMGEQICGTIDRLAYGGLLRTYPAARDRAIRIAEAEPVAGTEVVVLDTSALGPRCSPDTTPASSSRLNLLSAALAVTLARRLLREGCEDVGLVAPYRAQTRLLSAATRDEPGVTAATIHRFQGSERDGIVFDLTDGFPMGGPSRLTGGDPSLALRLCNVAASRARGKLVLVADLAFLNERHPIASPARSLLHVALDAGGEALPAEEVIETGQGDGPIDWFLTWDDAVASCEALPAGLAAGMAPGSERWHLDVPAAEAAGPWLDSVIANSAERTRITVRAPYSAAKLLEPLGVELRLKPSGEVLWATLGNDVVLIGSHRCAAPAARVRSSALARTLHQLLNPERPNPERS